MTPYTLETLPQQRVHFGADSPAAVAREAELLGAQRVWIASSRTLN